jgi:uncharacterized protein (TIGR02118 family)
VHKVVWFVKFRRDRDEADRRWATAHASLCLDVPGVVRYVQNPTVTAATLDGVSTADPPFDGFSAIWWSDRESYLAATWSREWRAAMEDARDVFDCDWTIGGMGAEIEERVIREGLGARGDGVSTPPAGSVKLIGLLKYRSDITRDEANAYWADTHRSIAVTIEEIGHYTQNHAMRPAAGSDHLAFDGFSESWYADGATYEQAMASREWKALGDDGPNLFDMTVFKSAIVEERVLRG